MAAASTKDPTVIAVPFYFATMAAEYLVLRRRALSAGPTAGDYERRDTVASLSMGVISLVAPFVAPRVLRPFTPGRGRFGRAIVATALGAAAVTTVSDFVVKRVGPGEPGESAGRSVTRGAKRGRVAGPARRLASVGGVVTTVVGGVAVATFWSSRTSVERMWRHRLIPSLGRGPVPLTLAVLGWDFIYYWNHRFMHESRYMWAVHVVHHSSEHYNLSTALRQPVADSIGTSIPYGALCLAGISPQQINAARGINLLYQYWIHTESINRLGAAEAVLNTPSHHRVHHGSNLVYIDRNHGSILIAWDRLFGTFQPEKETVVYGLTKNIHTFNLVKIAAHEYLSILRDVAGSTTWPERLSYVVRGPGWADRRRQQGIKGG